MEGLGGLAVNLLAVFGAAAVLATVVFLVSFYLLAPALEKEVRDSEERNADGGWP